MVNYGQLPAMTESTNRVCSVDDYSILQGQHIKPGIYDIQQCPADQEGTLSIKNRIKWLNRFIRIGR